MAISDDDFAALIRLIEDGEVDDRMVDLIAAIDERNDRRKGEILRLVKSVWGDAAIVSNEGSVSTASTAPAQTPQAVPDGHYMAQDGKVYPIPGSSQPPVSVPDAMGGQWPTPINSQSGGVGGVSPVRDPMSAGADPFGDNDPNVVSTGAQIG